MHFNTARWKTFPISQRRVCLRANAICLFPSRFPIRSVTRAPGIKRQAYYFFLFFCCAFRNAQSSKSTVCFLARGAKHLWRRGRQSSSEKTQFNSGEFRQGGAGNNVPAGCAGVRNEPGREWKKIIIFFPSSSLCYCASYFSHPPTLLIMSQEDCERLCGCPPASESVQVTKNRKTPKLLLFPKISLELLLYLEAPKAAPAAT